MLRRRALDTHALTARNIYALPTPAGWMMLVTVSVLMLATINYQLSLGYVLIFLLMGAGVVGLFLTYRSLTQTRLALSTAQDLRGKLGDEIEVRIETSTDRSEDQLLKLKLEQMGVQPLPIVICETHYPLGLLRLWSVWRLASTVHVELPAGDAAVVVSRNLASVAAVSDTAKTGIRAYRVGDSLRDVLWKTVAKRPDTPANWGVRSASDDTLQEISTVQLALPKQTKEALAQEEAKRSLIAFSRLRDLSLLCALLAIVLPFFQHLIWWYPLLACGLIGLRFWQVKKRLTRIHQWLQPVLIVLLAALVWLSFRTFNGIEASVSACLGLLGIKALELPSTTSAAKAQSPFSRDHWVLIFLGLFTLSAHFLVSQSLTSTVQVVMGLTLLLYVLVLSHMKAGLSAWHVPILRMPIVKAPLKTTLWFIIFGTPFMAVMFFLFPRFAPLWSLQEVKTVALTGLSSQMRVGELGEISRDNKIILRLQMETLPLLESKEIYLRSFVMPRFDGRTWTRYRSDDLPPDKQKSELDAPAHVGRAYTVTPLEGSPYRAVIAPDIRTDRESASTAYLQAASRLPQDSNPRTSQWLKGLREDAQFKNFNANDWSQYLLDVLRSGDYRYTLSPGTYGTHIVDELLFDRKLGFCEHYATAYVVAMRNLGIPARVVTGYQGAEINPIDGIQVVRNSNAHAWAEYWGQQPASSNGAWFRVDPTAVIAPGRIQNAESYNQAPAQLASQGRGLWSHNLLAPVFKSMWRARQSWEAANHAWEAWFTGYNQAAQMSWLKKLGIADPSWRDLVQLLDAALLILLLLGVGIYVWRGSSKQDPWLALLEAIKEKAQAQSAALPPNATPREIALAWPRRTPQITQWLMDIEAARYAPKNRQNQSLATLQRQLKHL